MTALDMAATAIACNASRTAQAVFGEGRVAIFQRKASSKGWSLHATLPADDLCITQLCWAPAEFGRVIAGGTADGSVVVWQETPGEQGSWRLVAALKEATLAVLDVAFAPPPLGPLLAVAYADGFVRLFVASSELAPASWELQNHFQIGIGSGADYGGRPVADVAWAPAMGRPCDVVAVAAGATVLLWELWGTADGLQSRQLVRLQHATPVWQVAWNPLGNWLAASIEGREVCMWRPDLGGEWLLLSRFAAAPKNKTDTE
ncbi:hypothetical protein CHLNCDRAFT_139397 [Chlorella variabilis]|uniref:Anaphase-promoting complex subunit 4 WD40 domain-containing protein n=1 Tax=Chlorella variabilis TaxID=554065 RepID=E1ZPQ0_CHLVA|nr:hypothetical protein CHLNCDRAFT_139397 [Chlorella variabilis]EFN52103.1 hypothetical protein CHLNCDRAFT_139397 [Chlorella variabilis]|eukprot:XP_005844205.1 hypothetical protein CHLNCDRAFT_139397 [Chlorella variabilis]